MSDHFDYGFFAWLIALVVLSAFLLGCGGAPERSRPPGVPYPTKLAPRPKNVYPIAKVRCMGGGIGGCQHPMIERALGGN